MSFLINSALASSESQTATLTNGVAFQFVVLISLMLVFYLTIVRPQAKRIKDQNQLLDALKVADEVYTSGGIAGRIAKLSKGNLIQLEVASGVKIYLQKNAVVSLLPKGTLKIQ